MKQTASALGLCDSWRNRLVTFPLAMTRLGPQLMRGR
jgi:hypothetical protein